MVLTLLLAGCATKGVRTGLVLEDSEQVFLVTEPGERTKLFLQGENVVVEGLLGCRVKVGGQAKLGGFIVDTYEVLDAGYGAPPHLGVIQNRGGRLMMDDQSSGALIELVGDGSDDLWNFVGELVLVNGVVVGPHQVRVMNHRVLTTKQGVTSD